MDKSKDVSTELIHYLACPNFFLLSTYLDQHLVWLNSFNGLDSLNKLFSGGLEIEFISISNILCRSDVSSDSNLNHLMFIIRNGRLFVVNDNT